MSTARTTVLALLTGAALLAGPPAEAATTVSVTLLDTDGGMTMPMGMGHGMMGNMSMASMSIELSASSVPAGRVNFEAVNASKSVIHEVVVAPLKSPGEILPYDAAEQRVREDEATHLGEVSELDPGASGSLGIDLKPGTYILYCNIPGHYMAGMWTLLTVTE